MSSSASIAEKVQPEQQVQIHRGIPELGLNDILSALVAHLGSKRKLETRFKISRGAIEALEKGQTRMPSDLTLQRLASAIKHLGVDHNDPLIINGEVCTVTFRQLKAIARREAKAQAKAKATGPDTCPLALVDVDSAAPAPEIAEVVESANQPVVLMILALPASQAEFALSTVKQALSTLSKAASAEAGSGPVTGPVPGPVPEIAWATAATVAPLDPEPQPETLPPNSEPTNVATVLDRQFQENSALLLLTLINTHIAKRQLQGLEGYARELCRIVTGGRTDRAITMKFKASLEVLTNDHQLPDNETDSVILLGLIAATVSGFEGQRFGGELSAFLSYIGC
jgi:transcriptional regulator with XRE-family HTH domain